MSNYLINGPKLYRGLEKYVRYTRSIKDKLPSRIYKMVLFDSIYYWGRIADQKVPYFYGYYENYGPKLDSFLNSPKHFTIVESDADYFSGRAKSDDDDMILSCWLVLTLYLCLIFAGGSSSNPYGLDYYKYDSKYTNALQDLYSVLNGYLVSPFDKSEISKYLSFLKKFLGENEVLINKDDTNYDMSYYLP